MDTTSIVDPPIPYIGPVPGTKFSPGKMVRIQGLAPGIGYRFNVNFQCGHETAPRDDVAVQISVRLLDGYISLNSLQHGIWGEEQRGALPVKRNEKFEIILMCDFNCYKVAINGQHYCDFPQRIHHDRITYLAIDGDVSIFRISYESAARSDAGVASGNTVSHATAPIPVPPGDNERDDFEMIDATTNRLPQPRIGPPPSAGFSQLPTYEAALDASSRPPYPTSGPVGMPFPTRGPVGTPYPTNIPIAGSPYSPAGVPRILPPPMGAPTPLNVQSSHFHPLKRTSGRKCWASCCAVVLGIMIIIAVVAAKVSVSMSRHNRHLDNTYYSSSYDDNRSNYGNSYDHHGSNNYGGYNSHTNNW